MIIAFGNVFSQVTTEQIYYGASSLSMSASDVALPKRFMVSFRKCGWYCQAERPFISCKFTISF